MDSEISKIRNIGISAHIDAGKTTLTERILFYTKRIHAIHEVRGKDGVGATMDSMELERERGITIQSAATFCEWSGTKINIIDTPGHVDFTIEVERALRVLDGAVLVLCAVGGVQSQTFTVNRQMVRYNIPRIAFINKCDRIGANPLKVASQLKERLGMNAVLVQLPLGLQADFTGVVDLVTMQAVTFKGSKGEQLDFAEIPEHLLPQAVRYREIMLDAASMCSDELTDAILEDRVTPELIYNALRKGVIEGKLVTVLLGSAYRNKGVQPLLEAVHRFLPSPKDVSSTYLDLALGQEKVMDPSPDAPLLALVFKIEEGRYGQLTYVRIYQGRLRRGMNITNQRTADTIKVGRLVRMHADEMADITEAQAGDIIALFGIDCASGDIFSDGSIRASMTSIHVPDPVVDLRVKTCDSKDQMNLSKALNRFTREDPTFRCSVDPESGETVISGMGELHLDVYLERLRREYRLSVDVGPPQVAYREVVTRKAEFDYQHKKQTGGAGQYGRIMGCIEPAAEGQLFEFENRVVGGAIPGEFIKSVEKGFRTMLDRGLVIGFPVIGIRVVLTDGRTHSVDSSDNAFQAAARGAFRQTYLHTDPEIQEPIMRVSVEGPGEFQGALLRTLVQRRGIIVGTSEDNGFCVVEAEVPLSEMFGYSNDLRSATQGKAEFTMEFSRYARVPAGKVDELKKKYASRARKGAS